MPRIRTLKPEAFQHRKVGHLSDRAFRLWIAMICHADDEGRLVADPDQLRILAFPYQPKTTVGHIKAALEEIAELGLVRLYRVASVPYADFPSWLDHQRINRPTKSKLPPFQACTDDVGGLSEDSVRTHAGSEGNGRDQGTEGSGGEARDNARALTATAATAAENGFRIPPSILQALDKSPRLGAEQRLRDRVWWQAEIRANTGVDMAHEVLKAEAYLASHPERHYRKLGSFLHNWLGRAEREPDFDRAE